MKHSVAALLIIALVCLSSCNGKPTYPELLVQADSAYVQGHYALADSLLDMYEQKLYDSDEAINRYHQLVLLERDFLSGSLNEDDFSVIDSLCRFYKDYDSLDKNAKAQFALGRLYYNNNDYPAALGCYLTVRQIAIKMHNTRLQCLVSRALGDLYYDQRMLSECIPYYKDYFYLSKVNNDTLRLAYAATCMGKVYTIESRIDSTIYYYKEAITLGSQLHEENDIVSIAQARLCDIYIQLEEYDSAFAIMPRNELNDENWAYWHYGQNHLDSATYYFKSMLGKYGWQAETEYLRLLANIEKERGKANDALAYYSRLEEAEDSLKAFSKAEDTQRINAQFNYNSIKQDRDKMETKGQRMKYLLVTILVAVLLLSVASFFAWKSYRQKKNAELVRERCLKIEVEKHYRQSMEQLEKNQMRMVELEQQLEAALREGNDEKAEELRADTQILTAENQEIRAIQQKKKLQEDNFKRQPLYSMVMNNVGTNAKLLTPDDWQRLAVLIDATYSDFTSRLISLSKLKDTELHVCYLLKMGVSPVDIGPMVGRVKSTVSMMSSRLYKKFTQGRGSAKELADFLLKF